MFEQIKNIQVEFQSVQYNIVLLIVTQTKRGQD